jgi:hypothetical protein
MIRVEPAGLNGSFFQRIPIDIVAADTLRVRPVAP